jgi:hypothetical protein
MTRMAWAASSRPHPNGTRTVLPEHDPGQNPGTGSIAVMRQLYLETHSRAYVSYVLIHMFLCIHIYGRMYHMLS